MLNCYGEIMGINNDLIRGNNIRMNNHQEGASALKQINNKIQRGSRLRSSYKIFYNTYKYVYIIEYFFMYV